MGVKILLSDKFSKEIFELEKKGDFEVIEKVGMTPDQLAEVIADYDCILIRSATKLPAEMVKKGTNLKLIGRGGIGVDNIHIPTATEMGIKVMNTPNANAESTAEHAIALMFSAAREIPFGTATLKNGEWAKKKMKGRQLGGQTVGIIGLGNIGKIVASKLAGIGMDVIAYDPFVKPDQDGMAEIPARKVVNSFKVKMVTLEELAENSDFITLHLPLTDSTKNLVDEKFIGMMKPTAILVDNARGGVVDEDALYKALKDNKIAKAALDVFKTEPVKESPLLELDNFICTPHVSASTFEAQKQVAIDLVDQVSAFFNDNKMCCVLNK